MIEYTIYDRGSAAEFQCVQPDRSAKSENAAVRKSGFDARHVEIVTREMTPDECRPWVGRRYDDAR